MVVTMIFSALIVGVLVVARFLAARPKSGTAAWTPKPVVRRPSRRAIEQIIKAVEAGDEKFAYDGLLFHGTNCKIAIDRGTIVLVPGDGAFYGRGVYASPSVGTAAQYRSGDRSVMVALVGAQYRGFRCVCAQDKFWRTDGGSVVARVVATRRVRMYVRAGNCVVPTQVIVAVVGETTEATASHALAATLRAKHRIDADVAAATIAAERQKDAVPQRRWWTRGLGLFLAAYFLFVWKRRGDYKSGWLGLFLAGRTLRRVLGFGDIVKAPQAVVEEAMKNLLVDTLLPDDGKGRRRQIRPHYEKSQLFWMVGTMTIRENRDGSWFGRDRYDFHRQEGQGVVAQNSGGELVWSFSELQPEQERKLRFALRYLHIPESLYREREGRLELSNNFWNWLGGSPFQTEVRWDPRRR